MLGYVDSAISRVRAVFAAELEFMKEHPNLGYTCNFSQLSPSAEIARLQAQNQVDNGYAFAVTGCETTSLGGPNLTFHITARPLHSGEPAFCSDHSGVVRYDEAGSVEKCIGKGTPLGS